MSDQVRRFWIRDAGHLNGKTLQRDTGHPRTLVAYKVDDTGITFATATWGPGDRFCRKHAHNKAMGRLKSRRLFHRVTSYLPKGMDEGEKYLRVKLLLVQEVRKQARPDTHKYRAATYEEQRVQFALENLMNVRGAMVN